MTEKDQNQARERAKLDAIALLVRQLHEKEAQLEVNSAERKAIERQIAQLEKTKELISKIK